MERDNFKEYNLIIDDDCIIGFKKDLKRYYKNVIIDYVNNDIDKHNIYNLLLLLDKLKNYNDKDVLLIEYLEQGEKQHNIILLYLQERA